MRKGEYIKMRDINRIYTFLNKLTELWIKCPDLRFWQLLNIFNIPEKYQDRDPFFFEEEEWIEIIDHTLNNL